jgi:hypothetical protein
MNEFNKTIITSAMPIDDDYVIINGVKYKKVEEQTEPKTLHHMLCGDNLTYVKLSERQKEDICNVVGKWISQFHPEDMSFENLTYCNAFFDALDKLRNSLYEKM